MFHALRIYGCSLLAQAVKPFCHFNVGPCNDSFTCADVAARRRELAAAPQPLPRPVVVLSGYRAPGVMGGQLIRELAPLTSGRLADFTLFSYPHLSDIHRVAARVATQLPRRLSAASVAPLEIDVIAISMGGLVARVLSLPSEHPLSLARVYPDRAIATPQIRRLFTLATPHRGARLAARIAIDPAARAMRPGSSFLSALDSALPAAPYDLVCYGTLNDRTVGCTNTAPPGRRPLWLPGGHGFAHSLISANPLVVLDLALRLRGAPPISDDAPACPSD